MEVRYDILLENIKKSPLSEKEELKHLIKNTFAKELKTHKLTGKLKWGYEQKKGDFA